MSNYQWIKFVRAYAEKNNLSYKDAMKEASKHYKQGAGLGASKIADFDSLHLEQKPRPISKPKRTILNKLTSPFASAEVKAIQAEDEERKKNKVYVK